MASTVMTQAPPAAARVRPRRFYLAMAVAVTLVVFLGFGQRYYLRSFGDAPPLRPLVHVHAAIFTLWLLLFLAQTALVATGRVRTHRRLGIAGAALVPVMLGAGLAAAITGARNGWNPGGPFADALAFLVVPVFDILTFTAFALAALHYRNRPDLHRRLMLLAVTGGLLAPAIVRIPLITGNVPLILAAHLPFLLASPVRDFLSRRRVSAVDIGGLLIILALFPARIAIARTELWRSFASWLVG